MFFVFFRSKVGGAADDTDGIIPLDAQYEPSNSQKR